MIKYNLLFGGNKGIGYEIHKIFKNKKVLTFSRSNSRKKNHIQCDLLNTERLKEILNKIKKKKIESIIFSQRYRGSINLEDYKLMISAPILILDTLSKNFIRGSSIVFIGSTCTNKIADDQNANYHAVRAGIIGIVKYYAKKFAEKEISVNLVSTSKILKKENRKFFIQNNKGKKIKLFYEKKIPRKKMLSSKDIADVVKVLLTSDAKTISGQNLLIDGGEHLV